MKDTAAHSTHSFLIERLMQIARVAALEEMASGFAHELNQPLGAIATFASAAERMLARPDCATAPVSEVLRHIANEALHAGEGIRRIRALFNDAGARHISSISELIEEIKPLIEVLAERAAVPLLLVSQPGLPQVNVDRLRIQYVLFTLVQNAVEASEQVDHNHRGPVYVDVSTDRYLVQVAVSDRGAGVSPEHRAQIFRPFFTTKLRGTGLGLACSRATIEAHEGSIGFDDVNGGGTRFWFRLPASMGA